MEFWRDTVSDPGGGLEVKITGGAGYAADAIEVFENINGTLLLAAVLLVIVLLILIYRSPIFLFIPLAAVMFAEVLARSVGYGLSELGVTINGQSSSIMSVLVLGAGTDYALLIVARYREESQEKSFGPSDQFAPELLYFSDCILNKRSPEPSGVEGLADVRIIRALLVPAESGRPVKLAPLDRKRRPQPEQAETRPAIEEPELVGAQSPIRRTERRTASFQGRTWPPWISPRQPPVSRPRSSMKLLEPLEVALDAPARRSRGRRRRSRPRPRARSRCAASTWSVRRSDGSNGTTPAFAARALRQAIRVSGICSRMLGVPLAARRRRSSRASAAACRRAAGPVDPLHELRELLELGPLVVDLAQRRRPLRSTSRSRPFASSLVA